MTDTVYVYFIQQGFGAIKIGVSGDPDSRCIAMQTGTSKTLRVIARIPFTNRDEAFSMEKELHEKYIHLRLKGEWFKRGLLREMRIGRKRLIGGTGKNPHNGLMDIGVGAPHEVRAPD